jgi:hypothetical protein
MAAHDLLGKRGEAIVTARLMDFCGNRQSYFDPHFLGEKCPTFDFLVELVGAGDSAPYFLAQVKTTRSATKAKSRRLSAKVSRQDVRRMARCPLPTYLIAVDEPAAMAYIVAILGKMDGAISSIPTRYPLHCENLHKLWQEVQDCWHQLDYSAKFSAFTL